MGVVIGFVLLLCIFFFPMLFAGKDKDYNKKMGNFRN